MASPHTVVAAFDIGTTSSCYAFSLQNGPSNVRTNAAWIKTAEQPSYRAPTCVLLNPDEEFDSFGYKAEERYVSLSNEGQENGWRFFRHVKL